MLVLGLQGSPKKNGSSDYLLKHFLAEIEKMGVEVQMLDVAQMDVKPCLGCGYCEKKVFVSLTTTTWQEPSILYYERPRWWLLPEP